jgi:hypothetical protein
MAVSIADSQTAKQRLRGDVVVKKRRRLAPGVEDNDHVAEVNNNP